MKIKYLLILLSALIMLTVFASCDVEISEDGENNESALDSGLSDVVEPVLGDIDYSKLIFSSHDYMFVEKYGTTEKMIDNEEDFVEIVNLMMSLRISLDFCITSNSENALKEIKDLDNISNFVQLNDRCVAFFIFNSKIDIEFIKELSRNPEIDQIRISVPTELDD